MTDHLDLVVHALQGTVGHPDARPGQYPVEMGPEHPRELLKGLQPAMGCPPEPLAQVSLGPTHGGASSANAACWTSSRAGFGPGTSS